MHTEDLKVAPSNGVVRVCPTNYIGKRFAHLDVSELDEAITWEQRDAPRGESYYADRILPYTYGRGAGQRTYEPHIVWPALLTRVRSEVESMAGCSFAMLFCNRYPDQHHHIGWHADDSPLIDHIQPIAVVSFGAEREIWFRDQADGSVRKQLLGHGSVLFMGPGMQMTHLHRIPKHPALCGLRVSLTFRALAPKHEFSLGRTSGQIAAA